MRHLPQSFLAVFSQKSFIVDIRQDSKYASDELIVHTFSGVNFSRIFLWALFCERWKFTEQQGKRRNHLCLKSTCIQSYSGPYFPAFGLNTERYEVSRHIQFKYRKMRTRINSNTDTFFAEHQYSSLPHPPTRKQLYIQLLLRI